MRTAAVLPVKRFALAKQRLSAAVEEPLRGELAQAMVGDVLDALAHCSRVTRTIVVSADPVAASMARAVGAIELHDRIEEGQSAAASLGIGRAIADGYERVLCVPGDCPALDPGEVDAMLDAAANARAQAVIVPDRHGTGTNALLLRPPDAIAPAFGPDSFERHSRLAHSAGVRMMVARPSSLVLDVDTGADLAVLRQRLRSGAGRCTRELLEGAVPA